MKETYKHSNILIPTLDTFVQDQWELTKGITTPRFSVVEEVYPNQEFQVIVLIGDYKIKDGKINLLVQTHIENKAGQLIAQHIFERTLMGELDEHIGFILLPELPKFRFEKADAEGTYQIVLKITDANSGTTAQLSKEIYLHPSTASQNIQLKGSLEQWRQNYYLDPKPKELLPRFLQSMDEIGMNDNANIQFYAEALNNALFLVEDIDQLLLKGELPQKKRNALNLLLARSNYRGPDLSGFSQPELDIHHKIRTEEEGLFNPLLKETLTHPSELDILWSMFFANGRYENVEKIMATLPLAVGKSLEEIMQAEESEKIQFAIGMASAWSLKSIGKQHPLVKVYMIHQLNNPQASEALKGELVEILEELEGE